MRVLFIKHDHASPGGLVGDAFTSLGYDVTEFTVVPKDRFGDPNVSVTFPGPRIYDAGVAFGAGWSVHDEKTIGNWISDEIAFTRPRGCDDSHTFLTPHMCFPTSGAG